MKAKDIRQFAARALRYLVASVSLAVFLYILIALVFSTQQERTLRRENRLYARMLSEMKGREELIGDVIEGLMDKDDAIYMELFNAPAPSLDAMTAADLIEGDDSLSESFYLSSAASKGESLMKMAGSVDDNFDRIFQIVDSLRADVPPLSRPLRDIAYVQTGASTGIKRNPVHGLELQHDGLDFVVPQGTPVYAAANGVVSRVVMSRKGLGNTVEIDHGNGYVTSYSLLGEVYTARGRHVKGGQKIGNVGILSSVSAPHLHYSVRRDTTILDPVNHLFLSVTPEEYARMLYLSVITTQSMD